MKILFISGLYPLDCLEQLKKESNNSLQAASNAFQWSIVNGLFENRVDFEVWSFPFLPSYPKKYKRLYTPKGDIRLKEFNLGKMISYCSLAGVKLISIQKRLESSLSSWIKYSNLQQERIVILTYSMYSPFISAIRNIKKKYSNVELISIVTDLGEDIADCYSNENFFKRHYYRFERERVARNIESIDKFVLLTKQMEERLPIAKDKNVVVEGLIEIGEFNRKQSLENDKILLYTGSFEKYVGIQDLIKAFMLTKNPNYKLFLCGQGFLEGFINDMAQKDTRIKYLGKVDREIALRLQREATALINPRKPNGAITKYSFPSKTMEYMASGTPMIGYKLEGMPEEYYENMYVVVDNSLETLSSVIDNVLSLSQEELNDKAYKAFNFIKNNKNSKNQVKKILDFIGC